MSPLYDARVYCGFSMSICVRASSEAIARRYFAKFGMVEHVELAVPDRPDVTIECDDDAVLTPYWTWRYNK